MHAVCGLPQAALRRHRVASSAQPVASPCRRAPVAGSASAPRRSRAQPLSRGVAVCFSGTGLPAAAELPNRLADVSAGLETPVQLLYLGALVVLLSGGAFLVVRQVLVRRELESTSKDLGERLRAGTATPADLFELGSVMLRKKVFSQAIRHLEACLAAWEGAPPGSLSAADVDLQAQAHNALGFAFFSLEKVEGAVEQYRAAVALQPGYVTAWNNLGDALEKTKKYEQALKCYEEALAFEPSNGIAGDRARFLRTRLGRVAGV
jgi:tetratricopeptide (TPR) repeat protein